MAWHVTSTELIKNFRGALLSIMPWVIKSKIPYLVENAYDDWDEIVSVLYEQSVMNQLSTLILLTA